ncbi:MAG: hypothetical protein JJU45_06455 [Acidimicrobiia bacterium]|nr:hypothetical protein [Acidimicrobiia bacterium]
MPDFLSPAWFSAADHAVRQAAIPVDGTLLPLVLEHVVVDDGEASVRWQVVVDVGGGAHVDGPLPLGPTTSVTVPEPRDPAPSTGSGSASNEPTSPPIDREATVRLLCDREVAHGLAAGTLSARDAFIAGRLQLGGDTTALLAARPILKALGSAMAAVTTSDGAPAAGGSAGDTAVRSTDPHP